jgi:hypothetical protein
MAFVDWTCRGNLLVHPTQAHQKTTALNKNEAFLEKIRRFTLSFPETTEASHFEKTSFRVKKKIFAT